MLADAAAKEALPVGLTGEVEVCFAVLILRDFIFVDAAFRFFPLCRLCGMVKMNERRTR
jgi:hypothetical protein